MFDSGDVLHAVQILAMLWLSLFILYGIYNVYFHPLREFPGPKLWSAYRFPYVYNSIIGRLPFRVLDLHEIYGPVVRVAPNELAFAQSEAWNDIYGLQGGRVQNQRAHECYTPQVADDGMGIGFITAGDEYHARLRRIMGQAFSPKAVDSLAGMLSKYSNLLVEQLAIAAKKNPVQDMSEWYNFTTFDLTGEFAMGDSFGCLERGGQSHFFLDTILGGMVAGLQIWQLERYKVYSIIKPFLPKSIMAKPIEMQAYTKQIVDRRMKRGYIPGNPDVLNYLLQDKHKRPENEIPLLDIYLNGMLLAQAGSETTATLLAGTTFLLGRHPDVLERATKEVRSAFNSTHEITSTSVNDLPYMIAVLSEALRLFPPAPGGFVRSIHRGGQHVAGHWVPEETRCAIYHYAASRLSANFTRPSEFLPQRWLTERSVELKNDNRDVVQPFMVGPRGCIGKGLAIAEMRLILAKMLWHFDFELEEPGFDWGGSLKAYLIWDRTPLRVRLKPVEQ